MFPEVIKLKGVKLRFKGGKKAFFKAINFDSNANEDCRKVSKIIRETRKKTSMNEFHAALQSCINDYLANK